MNKVIFIVGVGRSGTSMLQSMLNSHSQIAFPPETHFIRNYLAKYEDLAKIKTEIINDEDLQKLNIDILDLLEKTTDSVEFYKLLLQKYLEKENKNIIGDKDPKNIEYLKTIKKYFPNAYIIHIYRDPRAVIASRLKAKWSKDRPFWQHLLAYKAQFNYGREVGEKLFDDNYIEIKYEKLVENPQEELQRLCKSLDISYENGMLDFYKQAQKVVVGEEKDWKGDVFKPVQTKNIKKWKNDLTQDQIETIECVLKNEMEKLGYKKTANKNFCLYKSFIDLLSNLYQKKLR